MRWRLVQGKCPECGAAIPLHLSTIFPRTRLDRACPGCGTAWRVEQRQVQGQDLIQWGRMAQEGAR